MGGRHLGTAWPENDYLHNFVCCGAGRGFLSEQRDGGRSVYESRGI